nr:immunoglobulin light chain junction region [Macaca mulatta]MOV72383.1 immunoglobulin light chain junction region [Macaca mulatta]
DYYCHLYDTTGVLF